MINTEENAKVFAAVLGTEFIQFLAVLSILHQEDFKENDEFILFFKSSWCNSSYSPNLVQNRQLGKEFIKFCPPKQQRRPLPFFCIYPSMGESLASTDCRLLEKFSLSDFDLHFINGKKKLTFNSHFVILICLTVCKISSEFPFPIIYKLLAKQTA